MIKRSYTLYCNNLSSNVIYEFEMVLRTIEPSIDLEVINISMKNGEASRGIPPVGISLFCHFISNKEIKYRTSATKIYNNGLGYGINLLNIDLENYPKQFNYIDKNNLIEEIGSMLINSIKFCETYINVNF